MSAASHVCGEFCRHGANRGSGWGEVSATDQRGYRRDARADLLPYLGALRERVLIYDGGTGTELFTFNLGLEDYGSEATNGCP
jgi:hypothetical protein